MRYQRHYSVIGTDGQQKLNAASILVVGCGGIGSPVLLYLAAAGIGKIGLVDHDIVELSNLQRQVLFTTADIGQNKSSISKQRLTALNSEIEYVEHNVKLSHDNAASIFNGFDLVIDGSDNYMTRFLVNDVCCVYGIPFISASVLMSQGQVGFFNVIDGCYRCIYPDHPPAAFSPNCAESGVIGAVVGVVGTLATNLAINFVLGKLKKTQLIFYNGETLSTDLLPVTQQLECPACKMKQISQIQNEFVVTDHDLMVEDISLNDYFIIDVREPWEHQLEHIENDTNIKLRDLYLELFELNNFASKPILVYCKSGFRGRKAVTHLLSLGYTDVYNLAGGMIRYLEVKDATNINS